MKKNKNLSNKGVFTYNLLSEIKNFAKRIILPLMSILIIILFIFVLKNNVNMVGSLEIFLFIGASILVYLSATYILDRQTLLSIKEISPIWRGK